MFGEFYITGKFSRDIMIKLPGIKKWYMLGISEWFGETVRVFHINEVG